MIQPACHLVWVRAADGRLTPFDPERLAGSLQAALAGAGATDPLLAESVASAIHRYALEGRSAPTLSVREIEHLVATALTCLGLEPLARAYARRNQRTEIHLDEMAAAAALELRFYQQLAQRLAATADRQLALVQVRGLRACVMRLAGARRWHRGCRRLAEDIVAYIRARCRQTRPSPAAALNVQVFE